MSFLIALGVGHQFRTSMHRRQSFLRDVMKKKSLARIVSGVRHHSRTQTLAPESEKSKHRSIHCNEEHAAGTFVTMPGAENNRGCYQPDINISAENRELALQ